MQKELMSPLRLVTTPHCAPTSSRGTADNELMASTPGAAAPEDVKSTAVLAADEAEDERLLAGGVESLLLLMPWEWPKPIRQEV